MGISLRYLGAVLGVAMLAVSGVVALAVTWTSYTVTMRAATSNVAGIGIFSDCLGAVEVEFIDYDGVAQGYHYERAVYVKNKGTVDLYVTYTPTHVWKDDDQTHFEIAVIVKEFGLPCQLSAIQPIELPEKDITNPTVGFLLPPGKMIKIDIALKVHSVWVPQLGSNCWRWPFSIEAANP